MASGKIVGFQSFVFQDCGRKILNQAMRICQSVRGLKLGKLFMRLGEEFCREILREQVSSLRLKMRNDFLYFALVDFPMEQSKLIRNLKTIIIARRFCYKWT